MAIRVVRGPSAQAIAAVASRIGQGQAQRRDAEQQRAFNQQLQLQTEQQDRTDRRYETELASRQASQQQSVLRDQLQHQQRLEQLQEQHHLGLEFKQQEFTVRQHAEKQRIRDAMAAADTAFAAGNMDEREYAYAQEQLRSQDLGIQPRPRAERLTPQEEFEQSIVQIPDGKGGAIPGQMVNGKFTPLNDPNSERATEAKLQAVLIKQRQAVADYALKLATANPDNLGRPTEADFREASRILGVDYEPPPEQAGFLQRLAQQAMQGLQVEDAPPGAQPATRQDAEVARTEQAQQILSQMVGVPVSPFHVEAILNGTPSRREAALRELMQSNPRGVADIIQFIKDQGL